MNAMTEISNDVLTCKEGFAGRLRLNRPKALHSLNRNMVNVMAAALNEWRDDPDVRIILIDHAEGRGFCAGGDVVDISQNVEGHEAAARSFFFDEYRLNHLEYTYPKPGVAFMDGVTMGGGVGIACPCRYRVATERTVLGHARDDDRDFPRCRWRPLSVAASRAAGAIPRADRGAARRRRMPALAAGDALPSVGSRRGSQGTDHGPALSGCRRSSTNCPRSRCPRRASPGNLAKIDRYFASDRLENILADLDAGAADGDEWAATEAATIRRKSPTACKVSLKLLQESPYQLHFVDEMRMEYGIMVRLIHHPDFREGVRALLIDKDNAPRWSPATPEEISDADIDKFFEPLPDDEAWTPFSSNPQEPLA